MTKKILLILTTIVAASLVSCHRSSPSSSGSSDSTEIKKIEAMQERGTDYRNSSDFQRAIATHDSCIYMAERINDTIQLVIALNNPGTNYRRLSANKEAADYHLRALQLCDAYTDTTTFLAKKNRVRSLNGLGNVMLSLGNYETAEKAFQQALAGESRLNSATGQAINLANIGSIKEHAGQLDSARIYYNLSMQKNREDDNKIGISLCYTYLGGLDKKAGHIKDALNNYRLSYSVGRTTGDTWHELVPCLSLAEIYTDQFSILNSQSSIYADSAVIYIDKGMEAARKIHSNEHLRDLYAIRSRLEEKQGKTALALADLRLCTAYSDSVLTEEERTSIQNARAEYESSRRSVEVRAATEEAKTSRVIRNAVAATAVLIMVFMILAFLEYRHYVKMRHKAEKDREIFVRNIAHQLRTPMTVVTGMIEQLKTHIPDDDVAGIENLVTTQRHANELKDLILQLARMPKDEIAPKINSQGDIRAAGTRVTGTGTAFCPSTKATHNASTRNVGQGTCPHDPEGEGRDGASILLAEDNDDVAKMICGLLRKNGYSVNWAADGMVAHDILHQSELPDLLITDIAMPNMDGLELMRKVREDDTMCHLPIIVASARVEDSERLEGINAGAEVYLTKPFIPNELLLRVRTMLEQRERLRRYWIMGQRVTGTGTAFCPSTKATHNASTRNVGQGTCPHDPPVPMTQAEEEFIDRLNRTIDNNLASGNVTVSFIADRLSVSIPTINRKVKNITDMSCADYIQNRRLEYAKHLLLGHLTIAEIGYKCGIAEPTHFTRFFKHLTGITPSEFRKTGSLESVKE